MSAVHVGPAGFVLPIEPLIDRIANGGVDEWTDGAAGQDCTTALAARRLNLGRIHVQRMRRNRFVSYAVADRLAVMSGYHPTEIWGDAWLAGVDEEGEGPCG